MSRTLLTGLCVAMLVFSMSSCSIFKRGSKRPVSFPSVTVSSDSLSTDSTGVITVNEEKSALIEQLVPLWKKQFEFNTFSGKAKISYESKGQKQDLTGHFRIKKDSMIWATVTAAGGIVQVARVLITPEEFKLINYLDKNVTIISLSEAGKMFPAPVDFSILQNLIIGNVLTTAGTATDAEDQEGAFLLKIETPGMLHYISFSKPDTTVQNLQMRARSDDGPVGVILYKNYSLINNQRFPMARTANVINAGESYILDLNFNKADFDVPVEFPFSIPKNYKMK